MISAPTLQALLARTALRSARIAVKPSRVASAVLNSGSSRSFTSTTVPRNDIPTATTTTAAATTPAVEPIVITTTGRKNKRNKSPNTVKDKTKFLLKWGWFDPKDRQRSQLLAALREKEAFPTWVYSTYDVAKSFRAARARLWVPTLEEIRTLGDSTGTTDVNQWIGEQLEARRVKLEEADAAVKESVKERKNYISAADLWDMMDYEQQVDFVLRPVWKSMSEEQRDAALLKTRFDSIRKLGWRQGYSSGYPRPEGESSHLPSKLGAKGDEGWAAFKELQKAEEAEAWSAWQKLSPEERFAEEKAAWKLRDRSQVYIDDSDDCFILTSPSPRWYPAPERAGELTFLPNTVIKLVKNYTPEGQEYDPFKATFRVPLSMHKHALRSYLLSIYGLKTTWARSAIYRSPNTRDNRTGMKITGRGRTFKKVEVGLLEPFLFPEISPEFQKQHLLTSELDYERSRVYLKMTKTTRWRGKKSTEQYEQEIANRDSALFHNLDPLSSEGLKGDDKSEGEKFPRFMVKTKGLPSAKQGKILQLLSEERKVKEQRVMELVAQFKKDAQIGGSNNEASS